MIDRRKLLGLAGGAALTRPLAARAQQVPKVPRIGIIDNALIWDHFRQGLRDRFPATVRPLEIVLPGYEPWLNFSAAFRR